MLVKSSTAVDKGSKGKFSGSSFYYGSSSLYYLTSDGSFECAVPLEKEGPVQDVAWVPGNMQFVVLYGFMPAQGTLFDHKCKPLFTYGTGYRNTITWSPSGRYVALCGALGAAVDAAAPYEALKRAADDGERRAAFAALCAGPRAPFRDWLSSRGLD